MFRPLTNGLSLPHALPLMNWRLHSGFRDGLLDLSNSSNVELIENYLAQMQVE